MKKTMSVSLLIGLVISGVALYFAFRRVPFVELIAYLKSIDYFWTIPSTLLILLGFAIRVYRWQLILSSAQSVGFFEAFHPLMIGFMLNCILPGRVGEISRPLILNQKSHVPFSTGLATVAAERAFDVIVLLLLLSWMLMDVKIDPALSITVGGYILNKSLLMTTATGIARLCFLLMAAMILLGFESCRNFFNRMILFLPRLFFFAGATFRRWVYEKVCLTLIRFTDSFARGFLLLKDPMKMIGCFLLSLLIWGLTALSYYVMAIGAPGIHLSLAQLSVVMVIICVFISIPSAPGFWGIWEAGGVFALALFNIPAKDAAGFTLANHAFQMLPVILVGVGSAVMTGVNVFQISDIPQR